MQSVRTDSDKFRRHYSFLLFRFGFFEYGNADAIATVMEYVDTPIANLALVVIQRYRRPVESRSPHGEGLDTLMNELLGFREIAYREPLAFVDFAW